MMRGVKVKHLYVNDLEHKSFAAENIYRTAHENNTEIILAHNNQAVYDKSGLKLTNYVLADGKDDNDNSILTLLTYNNFSILFTGDAGINSIKSTLTNIPRNITVLKVPHHGANGGMDKDLAKYLNPEYSVISVGENKFGHPSLYTLRVLDNSIILRTDINNAIKFVVNKRGYKILAYDMKKRKFTKVNN